MVASLPLSPAVPAVRRSRKAVVVQANLFSRAARIVNSWATNVGERRCCLASCLGRNFTRLFLRPQ